MGKTQQEKSYFIFYTCLRKIVSMHRLAKNIAQEIINEIIPFKFINSVCSSLSIETENSFLIRLCIKQRELWIN